MKRQKRILSMLLCVFMIFGMTANVFGEETDVFDIISRGIASSSAYIQAELESAHEDDGVTYGYEWYIIALLRAGKSINQDILDEYFESVSAEAETWTSETKPTDIERVALTLTLMDKDITNVNGVNLAELIYNSEKLTDSSNELVYALLALDAADVEIPETAEWSRDEIITQILGYQLADGSFGLENAETGDIDMTAICLQALAPYQDDELVAQATEDALSFLKDTISADYSYSDNSNTTAQVLLTMAIYDVDVTDVNNGFGDEVSNIITTLDAYRNPDGYGYLYNGEVNSLATLQIKQAYDAYRKMHKESILYWDFLAKGNIYDDTVSGDESQPDTEKAEPADVYVTIASEGTIVENKDNGYMAQAPVTVTDIDENGTLTVDEALYAAHETYFEGGAEAGYSSYPSVYGLSLAILWGKGTEETSLAAGYWLNNASCWSLEDEVKEGDYLTAFNYYDAVSWGDKYSYFTQNSVSAKKGKSVTLELKYLSGYDADNGYAPVFSACADADIVILGDNQETKKTDADGKVKLEFSNTGDYNVMAVKQDGSIVPAVCKITVSAAPVVSFGGSSGGSGGSTATTYTVKFETNGGSEVISQKDNKNECAGVPDDPEKRGYTFGGWYTDKAFEEEYSFDEKVTKDLTLYAKWIEEEKEIVTFDENTYIDVKSGDWYYDAVKYVYENNLMQGTGEAFEPDDVMTREMLVTVIWRMEREPVLNYAISFSDVDNDEWYTEAVRWASGEGIVLGKDESTFGTSEEVTREQTAAILCRYAEKIGMETDADINLDLYEDADDISEYAISALKWAVKSGIMKGKTENTISPADCSTRAEIATMLMRFCEGIK